MATEPATPPESDDDPDVTPRRRISARNRRVLRDLHHRTWELELVVSGAVLFILSQVPSRLDGLYFRLDAVAGQWAGLAAFMGYYFLKLMVYTLVLAFALHLFTRAFWVALVGLDSVFPRGIRWDRLRQGPNIQRVYRSMLPTVRELIVGADAVASVIFAAAFAVVGGLMAAILSFVVVVALTLTVGAVLPVRLDADVVVLVVAGLVVLGTVGVQWLDRIYGARLAPTGLVARWIRRFTAVAARITGLEVYGPVQYTLFSQIGWRRASLTLAAVSSSIVAYFIADDLILTRGVVEYAATGFFPPQAGELGVDPVYYEEYRQPVVDAGEFVQPWVPTIPSETLGSEEVWVRLFVPLRPSVDPQALARICPDAALPAPGRLRRRDVLDGAPADSVVPDIAEGLACVARLWTVSLDDEPVTAEPVFLRHPDSGLLGVARYLDTRSLPPGRHRIRVVRAQEAHPPQAEGPPSTHDILFWR